MRIKVPITLISIVLLGIGFSIQFDKDNYNPNGEDKSIKWFNYSKSFHKYNDWMFYFYVNYNYGLIFRIHLNRE